MIGFYLVGSVVLGYLISLVRDLSARRGGRKGAGRFDEGAEEAG